MENLQWLKILKKVKLGDMSTVASSKVIEQSFSINVIVALGLIAGPFPALL